MLSSINLLFGLFTCLAIFTKDVSGLAPLVIVFTLLPQIIEAISGAIFSRIIFDLPWLLCAPTGILLSALSPAVVVPSVIILIENKRGVKKGIP